MSASRNHPAGSSEWEDVRSAHGQLIYRINRKTGEIAHVGRRGEVTIKNIADLFGVQPRQ